MTVIDIFPDRPRVVPKQKLSVIRNRKRKSCGEGDFMPEIQGCIVGNILAGDSNNLFSMEGNEDNLEGKLNSKQIKEKEENIGSSLTFEKKKILIKSNRAPVRSRRKSRWKLKFHHQALPPEYLRHYKQQEKKRRQSETNKSNSFNTKNKKLSRKNLSGFKETVMEKTKKNGEIPEVTISSMEDIINREDNSHDSERLKEDFVGSKNEEKSAGTSKDLHHRWKSTEELLSSSLPTISHLNIDVSQNKAFLQNLLTNQIEINKVEKKDKKTTDVKDSLLQFNKMRNIKHEDKPKSYSIPPSGKIMNYSDLPYMGEITLDGIKPRRGRKPKKADICHLIYKNYGQVFPGAPGKNVEESLERKNFNWRAEASKPHENSSQKAKGPVGNSGSERLDSFLPTVSGLINHKEVQNRIINSLLEKRLTQGMKLRNYLSKEEGKPSAKPEEPLNLCIRDLQSLKIKLSRKHGNFYETKHKESERDLDIKTEDYIKEEVINIDRSQSDGETTDDNDEEDDLVPFNLVTTELRESSDDDTFLNFNDQITMTPVKTPPIKLEPKAPEVQTESETNPMLFWPGTNIFLPGVPPSPFVCYPKLPEIVNSPPTIKKSEDFVQSRQQRKNKAEGNRGQLKRLAPNSSSKPAQVITKRKRSAIFIPPVPAETTTNPTTEVSICKFKFTGGAKPSLQEKKMLSVDSGGNFRYYSGTGDKSMRGYEYFPRESLQQCQENTGCSPSGVFLTAASLGSGEKIPEEIGHLEFFDPDFPIRVPTPKQSHPKQKIKVKTKKSQLLKTQPDSHQYRTLREHLVATKPETSDFSILQDEIDKDDGNSSDESGENFDWRSIPQSYFDNFKINQESIKDEDTSGNRKLRKTRKSLAREKLEQTFKEKGFLIQTQQLESAEGATYCKFRQLRKFTRYLFRSWKDYLPGNVRNLSVDAGVENPEIKLDFSESDVQEPTERSENFKKLD